MIARNPVQPGGKADLLPVLSDRLVGFNQNILHCILSILLITQHTAAVTVQRLLKLSDDPGIDFPVAQLDLRDYSLHLLLIVQMLL
ncbi:hypothetical protein D3C76_1653080 [compost metagenome]